MVKLPIVEKYHTKKQKREKFFQKRVDKVKGMWYNKQREPKGRKGLLVLPAGVAEQADARDLKSRDTKVSYRFDPGHRHQGIAN